MKFVGPANQDSFWILSIMIVTKNCPEICSSQSSSKLPSLNNFDMANLDCLLKHQDIELSDKAKDFKKLFETFQKTKQVDAPSTMENPMEIHLKMLENQLMQRVCEENAKILKKMEEMEARQNAKLDKIIALLEEKST